MDLLSTPVKSKQKIAFYHQQSFISDKMSIYQQGEDITIRSKNNLRLKTSSLCIPHLHQAVFQQNPAVHIKCEQNDGQHMDDDENNISKQTSNKKQCIRDEEVNFLFEPLIFPNHISKPLQRKKYAKQKKQLVNQDVQKKDYINEYIHSMLKLQCRQMTAGFSRQTRIKIIDWLFSVHLRNQKKFKQVIYQTIVIADFLFDSDPCDPQKSENDYWVKIAGTYFMKSKMFQFHSIQLQQIVNQIKTSQLQILQFERIAMVQHHQTLNFRCQTVLSCFETINLKTKIQIERTDLEIMVDSAKLKSFMQRQQERQQEDRELIQKLKLKHILDYLLQVTLYFSQFKNKTNVDVAASVIYYAQLHLVSDQSVHVHKLFKRDKLKLLQIIALIFQKAFQLEKQPHAQNFQQRHNIVISCIKRDKFLFNQITRKLPQRFNIRLAQLKNKVKRKNRKIYKR